MFTAPVDSPSIADLDGGDEYRQLHAVMQSGLYDPMFRDGEVKYRNGRVLIVSPAVPCPDLPDLLRAGGVPLVRVEYLTLLVLHPGTHPGIKSIMGETLAGPGKGAREAREELERFAARLWLALGGRKEHRRVLPVGLSGFLVADGHTVIAKRRGDVAINPGVWAATIDGGLRHHGHSDGLKRDLLSEVGDECSWLSEESLAAVTTFDGWSLSGVFVPNGVTALPGCAPTGLTLVYECNVLSKERLTSELADQRSLITHEASDLQLLTPIEWPTDLLTRTPAEPLVAWCGSQHGDKSGARASEDWDWWSSKHGVGDRQTLARELLSAVDMRARLDTSRSAREARFASRYFVTVVQRFPGLAELDAELEDVSSTLAKEMKDADPEHDSGEYHEAVASLLIPALAYLEQTRLSGIAPVMGAPDFGRLYEAVIYRFCHVLFSGAAKWPEHLATLAATSEGGIGSGFLEELQKEALRFAGKHGSAGEGEVAPADGRSVEPAGDTYPPLTTEVAAYLRDFDRETVRRHRRLGTDAELFLFAIALTAMRDSSDPNVVDYALKPQHQRWLSGNPLALFFKASGIIEARTPSSAEMTLGYQFCGAAARALPKQPGVHHTMAIYELRRATRSPARRADALREAAKNVDRAIELDPEWPVFYATRARVRRLGGQLADARSDLVTALDLVQRDAEAPEEWLHAWSKALEELEVASGELGEGSGSNDEGGSATT